MSTPFLRDKSLEFCTRVHHAHPDAWLPGGVIFFFSPKKFGLRWAIFSIQS